MDSGDSSNETRCISMSFTPEKGLHNTRGAFGRFEKTSKIMKKKIPTKRALRSSQVSNLEYSGYLLFSIPGR